MSNSTRVHGQLFTLLRQYSQARDLRHLKTLDWMVSALICSGQLSLTAWEPYIKADRRVAKWGTFKATAIYLYVGFLWGMGASATTLKRFYDDIR